MSFEDETITGPDLGYLDARYLNVAIDDYVQSINGSTGAVTLDVLPKDGDGDWDATGLQMHNLAGPDTDLDVANKLYVDTAISSIPSTPPGGSTTQLQYNNSGAFGGIAGLTYNGTTLISTLPETITIPTATAKALVLKSSDDSATNALLELQSSSATVIAAKTAISGTSNTDSHFSITATFPSTITRTTTGMLLNITTAGSSSGGQATMQGLRVLLNPGYTGSKFTAALAFINTVAGTGTGVNGGNGNYGVIGGSRATTTGTNISGSFDATGGNQNVGVIGVTYGVKVSALNIAVYGAALTTGAASMIGIAGYFTLNTAGDDTYTGSSAAIIANNYTTTSPMLILRDNGVDSIDAIDGGNLRLLADSQLLIFGGGQDATITYDGTNMIINPKLVGTGYLSITGDISTSGKVVTYNNIATEGYGVPAIVDDVALTAQGADITTTNFTNGGVAGTYRCNYNLQDTAADLTAGALTLTISWTDGAGATTKTDTQVLTSLGRTSGIFYIQLASGNITYAVAHTGIFGGATYALYISLERLK